MKLCVKCKNPSLPERRYILDCILSDILGLSYELLPGDAGALVITCPELSETASLTITEMLFANPADRIIDLAALPKRPLEHWYVIEPEFKERLTNPDLPIIYG
ncbi:MAG: hypothetical protein OEM52_12510, partial [bacterium]|nr:hypothetical protein [bacterium]